MNASGPGSNVSGDLPEGDDHKLIISCSQHYRLSETR